MNNPRLNTDARARQPSRNIARVAAAAVVALLGARATSAQVIPPDSLAVRLQRAEAAIAALQTQLAEQARSAVQTRSAVHVDLTGRVLMNAFGNSRRVNNVDNPQFVLPDPGTPGRGFGMSVRQTRLGIAVSADEALGGTFTGDLDVDFYGGQQPSSGGRTFPLVRLRTARAIVRWSNSHLLLGQEMPLISPVNPVSPAAVGTPLFATAGNLWLWLPQARFGVETGNRVRVGLQGAVLAPTSGDPAGLFDTDFDMAERSQRPYLQARVSVRWGEETRSEVGCGVHQGWLAPVVTSTTRESSNAFACDAILGPAEWLDVRGEFFTGQALRGLGGGGIGQNFDAAAPVPLETTGAWAQLNFKPVTALDLGAGCGADHPGPTSIRRRNDACAAYAMVRPGLLFFGAEFRRLRTEYVTGRVSNDYVTLTAGFGF